MTEHRIHNLSVTISLRNTDKFDTVFIERAEYYNTKGDLIRSYFKQPIFLEPMETAEIHIEKKDQEGGTGGNMIFVTVLKSITHCFSTKIIWFK